MTPAKVKTSRSRWVKSARPGASCCMSGSQSSTCGASHCNPRARNKSQCRGGHRTAPDASFLRRLGNVGRHPSKTMVAVRRSPSAQRRFAKALRFAFTRKGQLSAYSTSDKGVGCDPTSLFIKLHSLSLADCSEKPSLCSNSNLTATIHNLGRSCGPPTSRCGSICQTRKDIWQRDRNVATTASKLLARWLACG